MMKYLGFFTALLISLIGAFYDKLNLIDECTFLDCAEVDYTFGYPAAMPTSAWLEISMANVKEFESQILSSDDAFSLLEAKQYHRLDEYLTTLERDYSAGKFSEFLYQKAIHNVSWNNLAAIDLIDQWIKMTDSAFAFQAKGISLNSLAYKNRGTQYFVDTSSAQISAFNLYLHKSSAPLEAALLRNPKLSVCYGLLFDLKLPSRQYNDHFERLTKRIEQHVPHSYYARKQAMQNLLPRWGGSHQAMRAFALRAQRDEKINPSMRGLLGREFADLGDSLQRKNDYLSAIKAYDKAIYHWPWPKWFASRGRAYLNLNEYAKSEADFVLSYQILDRVDNDLVDFARVYRLQKKYDLAKLTLEKIIQKNPQNDSALYEYGWLLNNTNHFNEAKDIFSQLIAKRESPYNYFALAIALYKLKDDQVYSVTEKFLELCKYQQCDSESLVWGNKFMDCMHDKPNCAKDEDDWLPKKSLVRKTYGKE